MSEDSQQSWTGKLGKSLGGVVFGFLLFLASFVVLFWNEGRTVRAAKDIAEGAANTVSVKAGKVDPANEGKLVHLTGKMCCGEKLTDPKYGVSANAVKLKRNVEMYQWKEEKKDKSVTYSKVWSATWIDSSKFEQKDGHVNLPGMPESSWQATAQNVTVGDFAVSQGLLSQANDFKTISEAQKQAKAPKPVDFQTVTGWDFDMKTTDGGFSFSAKKAAPGATPVAGTPAAVSAEPQIGDWRMIFQAVPVDTEVSLIAQQKGNSFEPYKTKEGNTLEVLKIGNHTAAQMYAAMSSSNNTLKWILRIAGFVMMFLGLGLVAGPLNVLADAIPFVGTIVGGITGLVAFLIALPLTLVTIGVAWVYYRPVVGIAIIAIAAVILALGIVLKTKKARARRLAKANT